MSKAPATTPPRITALSAGGSRWITVAIVASTYRSRGRSPVCLAIRESIFGPISSFSWEGEDEIRPTFAGQCAVGPRLPLDAPPNVDKGGKNTTGLSRRPLAHAAATEILIG